MGKAQRSKGARGERQIAKELGEMLDVDLNRDLSQSRDGGGDLLGLPGWVIEVKSYAAFAVTAHLEQAHKACKETDLRPLVILNPDRKEAMALLYMSDLAPLLIKDR